MTDGNYAAGMQLGYGYGATAADFNIRYNYEIAAGTSRVDGYGNLDKNVVRNWKATVNTDGDKIPGKWVTVTMQVVNNKAGKLTVNVAGVPEVVFETPAASHAEKVLQDKLFLQFNRVNVEIYDYRVVAGVNVGTGAPAQPANPANAVLPVEPVPAGAAESGEVLYYQRFGSNYGATLGNIGLSFPTPNHASVNENGYLTADSVGQGSRTIGFLPVALSSELGSYTLECTFRFFNSATYKQGCMILGLGGVNVEMKREWDSTFGATGGKKNNWSIDPDTGVGKWVALKLKVNGNELTSVEVTASGETLVYSGETLTQPTKTIPTSGNIALACYHAGVQIRSVRLVSGVDYTQLAGENAHKSYSGYVHYVNNVGLQTAKIGNAIRLVGEIYGTDFLTAGFRVSIDYTDANDVNTVSGNRIMPVHVAYTSIMAGDGTATPDAEGYYLIVMEISEMPENAQLLKITFTPYADTYEGDTYVYDYVNQTITISD